MCILDHKLIVFVVYCHLFIFRLLAALKMASTCQTTTTVFKKLYKLIHSLFLHDKYVFSLYIDGSSKETQLTSTVNSLVEKRCRYFFPHKVMEYMPT